LGRSGRDYEEEGIQKEPIRHFNGSGSREELVWVTT
jgi:hypothetical protein